ncbi:hypothetical protein CFHF_19620 [Caulobacter flavus]|uniref:HTH gntR-type domain-containing protein n=1 Tax=Caulobacter flavus TaxID=1679497 RepID=A0A2N5CP13_9CAUL|nr:GntR family transcriptional regulator [Caulobacter flavus]AYV48616.1 hypothetical protein C1707_21445 [Caulobacter flavus]PLR08668.1 hypothetical protein CFHF_19620 [Caulobacter flavus]
MGRDRDPFDRTFETLRQRLTQPDAVRGAPLAVIPLAQALGVSPTPVREALAKLSGEGLVVRTAGGYRGLALDRGSLADRYDLAAILAIAAANDRWVEDRAAPDQAGDPLALLASLTSSRTLARALLRVSAQLAPFAPAEAALLGRADAEAIIAAIGAGASGRPLATLARRYCRRRARRAGDILARTLGLS